MRQSGGSVDATKLIAVVNDYFVVFTTLSESLPLLRFHNNAFFPRRVVVPRPRPILEN
jgi:hypothetical protein